MSEDGGGTSCNGSVLTLANMIGLAIAGDCAAGCGDDALGPDAVLFATFIRYMTNF